jgi:signal peptidase II
MRWILLVSLPLYLLDRLTKGWVLRNIDPQFPRTVIRNYFDLVQVTNTGAAFGSFKNNNLFFIVLSCIALVCVAVLLVRPGRQRNAWRDVSLSLLLAGVVGNLTDRLSYGHVIDFLLFDLHLPFAHPWPAFNVADSCICIAVICFIVYSLREKETSARKTVA